MIVFENPGEIDPIAISTFGMSAKEGENPIGFFGTGLKYAIAILLRSGHTVRILSGDAEYTFGTKEVETRGKQFQVVTMNDKPLGFTTDVGKNWKMWMAYREIYCNCIDEDGRVFETHDSIKPEPNTTKVLVKGEEFELAHTTNHMFLLFSKNPLVETRRVDIHPGTKKGLFYRGVLVRSFENLQTRFTYNIKRSIELTEDRTAKWDHECEWLIVRSIVESDDEDFIEKVLLARDGFLERTFDYRAHGVRMSATFKKVIARLMGDRAANICPSALREYKNITRSKLEPNIRTLSPTDQMMLDKALHVLEHFNFKVEYDIVVTDSLGEGIMGLAEDNRIYLSQSAFDMGTKYLAMTVLEEYFHLKHGYIDETRAMQNHLFQTIATIMEYALGEPM